MTAGAKPGLFRMVVLCAGVAGCTGAIDASAPGGPEPLADSPREGERPPGNSGKPSPPPGTGGPAVEPNPGATPGPGAGPTGNDTPIACDAEGRGAGPRRLWRLNATQYANTVAALLGGAAAVAARDTKLVDGLAVPFGTKFPGDQFSTQAASYGVTEADLSTVMVSAGEIADRVLAQVKAEAGTCLGKGDFAGCAGKILAEKGALMFRRPLAADELSFYRDQAAKGAAVLGEEGALAAVLEGMALSPHFLFRTEIGDGTRGPAGYRLTSHEVASALSYSLTDWPPDAELLQAARAGALSTPEQVRAHAERLLGTLGTQPKVLRFFDELFELAEVTNVFKEPKQFPHHNPAGLLEDVRALISDVLATSGRERFLETLLSTRTAVVRAGTLGSYGLPADPALGKATKKVTLPEAERAGLLTHPAFLVAAGDNDDRHPVEFGHYLREQLLCQHVPAIPAGLAPMLPEGELTWREKLAITRKPGEVCWSCHEHMDPLGLAFQHYDHTGRYRMTEVGKPIVAADTLKGAGAADGPFRDGVDLALKLSKSSVVEQCLVRQSFRYWIGRLEERFDGCLLRDAHQAYRAKGSYADVVTTLMTSDAFLFRQ